MWYKSYGINVAKLAGLPEEIIKRANDVLVVYEKKEIKRDKKIQTSLQLDFNNQQSEVEEELKKINILEITPIEAMNILHKLKSKLH